MVHGIVVLSLTKATVFLLQINAGYAIHLVVWFMDYKAPYEKNK